MNEGNLLDYLKILVRNRLTMSYGMRPEEGVAIPNFDQILADLPVYIRKAILELQMMDLIPPYELVFTSIDRKRETLKPSGDLRLNYYDLPLDFRELKSFKVDGLDKQPKLAPNNTVLASWSLIENRTFCSFERVNESADGPAQTRLFVYPFPEDDKEIYISYSIDGTQVESTTLPEKYWDSVASVVYRDLGLMSSYEADDVINNRVNQEKHPQGIRGNAGERPRVRPSYFTNTSKKIRSSLF